MEGSCVILTVLLLFLLVPPSEEVGFELKEYHEFLGRADDSATEWCYDKSDCNQDSPTSDWMKDICKDGKRQSPIDIPGATAELAGCPVDFGMTPDDGYNLMEYYLQNFGKTMHIHCVGPQFPKARFRFPDKFDGIYTMLQGHFHWGPTDDIGSEHLIDGTAYSLELHLVHYRSGGPYSFPDPGHIEETGISYAVLGFMFKADAAAPSGVLDKLVAAFDKVPNESDKIHVTDIPFLIGDEIKKQTHAYHYEGSLTTPTCNEVVQWLVMKDPILVKPELVDKFRTISKQSSTFRKLQDLNDRTIKMVPLIH